MPSSREALRPAVLVLAALLLAPGTVPAKVFHSRSEALALAFPEAERVETRSHVLTDEQKRAVEARARAPLASKLVTFHTGWRGERVLGHAFIDVHDVRTLPEALLVVLSPGGEIRSVRVLAFHEPAEYLPPARWLAQFEGRAPGAELRLRRDVHAIAGATLTAQAVTRSVRRVLALYQVLVAGAAGEE